jgi:hypothetical protein
MRILIYIYMTLCSLQLFAHPNEISLYNKNITEPLIGHIYVFSKKQQIIRINAPLNKSIHAQLYRVAGNSVAPTGKPITITQKNNAPTKLTIDFPASDRQTQYMLIFDIPKKKHINITALPNNHLDRLRKITLTSPVILVHPPEGIAETLRQLDITSVTQAPPSQTKGKIVIYFRNNNQPLPRIKAERLLIVSNKSKTKTKTKIQTKIKTNQEIWIQQTNNSWKIVIPTHYITAETLLTAQGQAQLHHLLLNTPEST